MDTRVPAQLDHPAAGRIDNLGHPWCRLQVLLCHLLAILEVLVDSRQAILPSRQWLLPSFLSRMEVLEATQVRQAFKIRSRESRVLAARNLFLCLASSITRPRRQI